jgi:hypothetical protein
VLALLIALLGAAATSPDERPAVEVPALAKAPRIDGQLGDLAGGLKLTATSFQARVGRVKDTLYLGVDVTDASPVSADLLKLTLHFPTAGTTAAGYGFTFAQDGQRADDLSPRFAKERLKVKVKKREGGMTYEVAIPARAFPRFPARAPFLLDLCVTYEDREQIAAEPKAASNCQGAAMLGSALKLADGFLKELRVAPPKEVEGVEGRPTAWLGYGQKQAPVWVQSSSPLTAKSLRAVAVSNAKDPEALRLFLPPLKLPDGRSLFAVVWGDEPHQDDGRCSEERELKLALYAVKDNAAQQVMEWPAASCALGKAISVVWDDGDLVIGYSTGATVRFTWSEDHFERTEIG